MKIANIAICDDNIDAIYILKEYINKLNLSQINVVFTSTSGKELIDYIKKNKVDIVLLDIELEEENGIDIAEEILSHCEDMFIIFITSHGSYAIDSFRVRPSGYILKPLDINTLKKELNHVIDKMFKKKTRILTVKSGQEDFFIYEENIIFIEKKSKKIIIYEKYRTVETYDTLDSFILRLSKNFYRSHKSFIININKIRRVERVGFNISKEVFFTDYDITALVSRSNVKELNKLISNS